MELSSAKHKWFSCLDNTLFKMKEIKLIEMQKKIEVLGSALKNTLLKLEQLCLNDLLCFLIQLILILSSICYCC